MFMKKKTSALVILGLLVLTLAGCSNPLSSKTVPTTTSPKSSGEPLNEGDMNQEQIDAADESAIMGEVTNINVDTITLSLVKKGEAADESVPSSSPATNKSTDSSKNKKYSDGTLTARTPYSSSGNSSIYTSTGETTDIKVTDSTNIILKTGELADLSNVKIGDIIIVQMSGATAKIITIENTSDKLASRSDNTASTSAPAFDKSSPSTGTISPEPKN